MKPRSNKFYLTASSLVLLTTVFASAITESVSAELLALVTARPMVTRTWDGGGTTNNWSEGANWSGDVAPGSGDDVVFDGTSTKNAVIDSGFSIASLQINTGYTGTVSQGSATLSISGPYTQAAGTFDGGSGVLNLSSNFTVNGGTFSANAGTVAFIGGAPQTLAIPNGFAFNNLVINKSDNIAVFLLNTFTITVNGTLDLTNGRVDRNSSGTLDAKSDVLIASTFDGGTPGNPAFLHITGSATRTVTFPVGAKMLPLTVNAPNATLNFSGAGTFTFDQAIDVQNAAGFSNGPVNVVFQSSCSLNGFTQGSGNLTFNFTFMQTAGTFTSGSGSLNFNSTFALNGGTFNAPSGNLNFPAAVTVASGATFNHNGGTIVFNGTSHQNLNIPANAAFVLNNILLNKTDNTSLFMVSNGTLTTIGTMTLTDGGIDLNSGGTKIDAQGDVIMAPTFDGGPQATPITLQISGAATRTVSFPVGAKMLPLIVNAPNVTVNTSGAGTFNYSSVDLQSAASFTNGSVNAVINGPVNLASAMFTQGTGALSFQSSYTQTAGMFTASNGGLDFNAPFALNGGTFNAPSGVVTFGGEVRFLSAATFNPNAGTVIFDGSSAQQFLFIPTTFTLNNVTVNRAHNTELFFFNSPSTLIATGTLQLLEGRVQLNSVASIDAQGDVIVGALFDGGQISNFRFTGSVNQTFSNNGGVNPHATIWRINKTPTAIVTAATSLELTSGQQLIIDSGTLYLNPNSNLTTSNLLGVAAAGKLINDSSTMITLGDDVTVVGVMDLNGSGASCPGQDTVLIRSTNATQRSLGGNGVLKLIDVDLQNMTRGGLLTVFSSTDSGGNSTNLVFDPNCPTNVSISPGVAGVPFGDLQIFTASSGASPYTFSIPVNNSGATITQSGNYTAGNVIGAVDTVRVTDAFGSFADATVNVTGNPAQLGVIVQPSNTASGQSITPPMRIAVQDSSGRTITTTIPSPTITISIGNNPSGGTLSGTLVQGSDSGVATFDNLSIDNVGTGYTLRATSNFGSLTPATSNAFNISAGGPTQVGFLVQPSNVPLRSIIAPPVQVAIQDALGNTVPNATDPVTIAIGNNPGSGVLSGTLTQNAVGGVATFSDLSINFGGTGFTLVASSGSLVNATSTPFDVTSPLIVTNTNDDGPGSLRQAIIFANNDPGMEFIRFNIPGVGPFVINVQTSLPTITDRVSINGGSQPGHVDAPVIEVRGVSQSVNGFRIASNDCLIQELSITGFNNGISVLSGQGNLLGGNYIGLEVDGETARSNRTGIAVGSSASGTGIGGINSISSAFRNVISGNAIDGIVVFGPNTQIEKNYIGTNAAGTTAAPNTRGGVSIQGDGAIVRENVISGNQQAGIALVGGATATSNITNALIEKNRVGLAANSLTPIPNTEHGIRILGPQARGVRLSQNRVFGNGLLGILLQTSNTSVPLPNDPSDPDSGPNGLQNYPNLSLAFPQDGTTRIGGSLNSTPSSTFRLEFFSSPNCDPSGNGEGETFIGSADVTTDAGGISSFISPQISLPVVVVNGRFITATATDAAGNTSEFSKCTVVGPRSQILGAVLSNNGVPIPNVQVRLTNPQGPTFSSTTATNSTGNFAFSFLPPADYTLTVIDPNRTYTPATRFYPNLTTNQNNQNFVAGTPQNFILRGRARTTAAGSTVRSGKGSSSALPPVPAGGFPLLGVAFNVVGPGVNQNVTNDSFGNYRFDGLPPATYVLTPTKPNYIFNPPLANITIGSNETVDFEGTSLDLSTLSGRIVYDSLGGIKAMNADGSGLVTISPNSARIAARILPRFARNGQRIVFVARSTTNAGATILDMGADGTGREFLYDADTRLSSPVYSPDGTRIAFHNATNNLVIMNADGSNAQSVVGNCTDPDWSPDGTQIVCVETSSSTTNLVKTVNLNTTAETTLDSTAGRKFSPRWSPDGTKIAFIRRQSGTPGTHSIVVRHLLGGTDSFMTGTNNLFQTLSWSPDGARLLFTRDSVAAVSNLRPPGGNKQLVTIQASDGQNMLVIVDGFDGDRIDWGVSNSFATPASPTPTAIQSGAVSISFPSTTGTNAFTTITPIEPNSAGSAPNGFVIGNFAFEINTTAGYTPPVTICIDLDDQGVQTRPFRVSGPPALMHNENGVLVNITTSYDDTTGIICGEANSFSPFVVAEQVNPALPSVTGLVIDSNGDPMSGVLVNLTGAETNQTQTDSSGLFSFVNLMDGANYNVQPQSVGYLFTEYSRDLLAVTGENTVVFTGTANSYQIAGRVADPLDNGVAGVAVTLEGAAADEVTTDTNGNYIFTGLPADGSYFVSPSSNGLSFSPGQLSVSALTSDIAGMDFTAFAPTAASVSVGGRVLTAEGQGINKARVSIADAEGNSRTTLTNGFGYYRFDDIEVGRVYLVSVEAKRHQFENPSRAINVVDELTDVNFVALPSSVAGP